MTHSTLNRVLCACATQGKTTTTRTKKKREMDIKSKLLRLHAKPLVNNIAVRSTTVSL